MSTDEQNDHIRALVEREIPTPIGGFDSEDAKQEFRERHDRRFMEICRSYDDSPQSINAFFDRARNQTGGPEGPCDL